MSPGGIALGVLATSTFGSFMVLAFWSNSMKSRGVKIVLSLLLYLAIFLAVGTATTLSDMKWNDGYCINCGTRYQPYGISRTSTYYYCPDCGYELAR